MEEKYTPKDVAVWLTKVFGESILLGADEKQPLQCWHIEYTGNLYCIHPLRQRFTAEFVQGLRSRLQGALDRAIMPESWNSSLADKIAARRTSDLPLAVDFIREDTGMNIAQLKVLAERLKAPADWVSPFVRELIEKNNEWGIRHGRILRMANEQLLGMTPEMDGQAACFSLGRSLVRGPVSLNLYMNDGYGRSVFPLLEEGQNYRYWRGHFENLATELGIETLIDYREGSSGGYADVSEASIGIASVSVDGVENKLSALLAQDVLPRAQQYIKTILAQTHPHVWLGFNQDVIDPVYAEEYSKRYRSLVGQKPSDGDFQNGVRRVSNELISAPRYKNWQTYMKEMRDMHLTTGALIETLFTKQPLAGQEDVYAEAQAWFGKILPLLTAPHTAPAPVFLHRASAPRPVGP